MSNVHVVFFEDNNHDVFDVDYYHHSCAPRFAKEWPAPEAMDYPVYCNVCEDRIEEIPLTKQGHKEFDIVEDEE